jgi:hypothetical protein
MSDILKVNYDDFYKFIISGGVLLIILWSLLATYFAVNSNILFIIPYLVLDFLTGLLIGWAGTKWYGNQKYLDEKLKLEVDSMKLEIMHRNLVYKKLEYELNPKNPIISRNIKVGKNVAKSELEGEVI